MRGALTMSLSGRPEAFEGRRRHADIVTTDHLRLRRTRKAAKMMMKTAMMVAERMCYSKTLAAPNHRRSTARSKRGLEGTQQVALCACGVAPASEGNIVTT